MLVFDGKTKLLVSNISIYSLKVIVCIYSVSENNACYDSFWKGQRIVDFLLKDENLSSYVYYILYNNTIILLYTVLIEHIHFLSDH